MASDNEVRIKITGDIGPYRAALQAIVAKSKEAPTAERPVLTRIVPVIVPELVDGVLVPRRHRVVVNRVSG
jgi:hypothetical protein